MTLNVLLVICLIVTFICLIGFEIKSNEARKWRRNYENLCRGCDDLIDAHEQLIQRVKLLQKSYFELLSLYNKSSIKVKLLTKFLQDEKNGSALH